MTEPGSPRDKTDNNDITESGLRAVEPGSPQRGTCATSRYPHLRSPSCHDWKPSEAVPQSEPAREWNPEVEEYRKLLMERYSDRCSMEQIASAAYILAGAGLSTQSEATSHVYRARCQNPCILDGATLLGMFVYDPTNGPVRFERAIDSKERAQGTSEDERALAAAIVEIVFNELDRDCNWLTGEDHAIGLVQKRLMQARASSLPKESK